MKKGENNIIIQPLITEKAVGSTEIDKYIFKVVKKANKIEVKKAVEDKFKVKVLDVNIINIKGKKKTFKRIVGRRSDYKKAIVTLKKGEKIEMFK